MKRFLIFLIPALIGASNIECNKTTGIVKVPYKGKKVILNFQDDVVDGGFSCKYLKLDNYLYVVTSDGLSRVNLNNKKVQEVAYYDGIGTLWGYKLYKNYIISWGGEYKRAIKLTNLKSLKIAVIAKNIDTLNIKDIKVKKDKIIVIYKNAKSKVYNWPTKF